MNATAHPLDAIRTALGPNALKPKRDDGTEELRWRIHLRMLNRPYLMKQAALGTDAESWYGDAEDLDALDDAIYARLEQPITAYQKIELSAAQTVLDCLKQDRQAAEDV